MPLRRFADSRSGESTAPSPLRLVGGAHVVVGALVLSQAVLGLVLAGAELPGLVLPLGITAALGAAMGLAGLWLRDGVRRGAWLAAALDGLRVLLVLVVPSVSALDVLVAVGLLAGVIWVWPELPPPSDA